MPNQTVTCPACNGTCYGPVGEYSPRPPRCELCCGKGEADRCERCGAWMATGSECEMCGIMGVEE